MSTETVQHQWRSTLEACVADLCERGHDAFNSVAVLMETGSTQDDALGAEPGRIVTAIRQTGGRGRQGKQWIDDRGEGIAATFVVPADHSGRLAIAAALAAADAVAAVLPPSTSFGVKWPNDLLINRCKVGGVLIEQDDRIARIGIGINVRQQCWPPELEETAISLIQAGADVSRLHLLELMVAKLAQRLNDGDAALTAAYHCVDLLRGAQIELCPRNRAIRGRVIEILPLDCICLKPDGGEPMSVPVAEASKLSVHAWPDADSRESGSQAGREDGEGGATTLRGESATVERFPSPATHHFR